jgi:hypothetical protein
MATTTQGDNQMRKLKKVTMRDARELLIMEILPEKSQDTFLPDQVLGHAFELLETACKRDKRLNNLRWNLCNGSGIKSHDKEAFKRGEYYTCTISGRAWGASTIYGVGETIQQAIIDAIGKLRGYEVEK